MGPLAHCLAPAPLVPAAAALALTLFDHDTPVWLDSRLDTPQVRQFLSFHSGATFVGEPDRAQFALIGGELPALERFFVGTDTEPERSATLIVQVSSLQEGRAMTFEGPGIETVSSLAVADLSNTFAGEWAANNARFPRGVDLILTDGRMVAALPRTSRWSHS